MWMHPLQLTTQAVSSPVSFSSSSWDRHSCRNTSSKVCRVKKHSGNYNSKRTTTLPLNLYFIPLLHSSFINRLEMLLSIAAGYLQQALYWRQLLVEVVLSAVGTRTYRHPIGVNQVVWFSLSQQLAISHQSNLCNDESNDQFCRCLELLQFFSHPHSTFINPTTCNFSTSPFQFTVCLSLKTLLSSFR